jgi:uncharacterized membrane protein
MIEEPIGVLAVLLGVLAGLFALAGHPIGQRCFKVVPLLVFAYFVPTALSNIGVIPLESPLYEFIKMWLLPASLLLLTMSVDIPAVLRLGKNMLILFLAGTLTVVVGGPLAYLALGWMVPAELGDQAWKGLAALSGSWIGGGANFIAIGKSVGATDSTMAMIVVVDVAVANVWMAVLLFFSGHEKKMDARIGADRRSLEELRAKSESFQKEIARIAGLNDLFAILFIAIGGTVLASALAPWIAPAISSLWPAAAEILSEFAWKVLIVTGLGVAISYTPLRKLEGAGASKIGSVLLYLLVACIGARAQFAKVVEVPSLLLIGAVWIALHATALLLLRRFLRAPIFCMAVGSQANIGGAASAPIVAGAYHPALASVGALMGVVGYVLGTGAGLLCAFLLRAVYQMS